MSKGSVPYLISPVRPTACTKLSALTMLFQSIKLEDNVPRVQPTPQSIDYEVAPQSNLLQYVDHAGYKTDLGSEVEVPKPSLLPHLYSLLHSVTLLRTSNTDMYQ